MEADAAPNAMTRVAARVRRALGRTDSSSPTPMTQWPAPWNPRPVPAPHHVQCSICAWEGPAFEGPAHAEGARCPECGSIARDRFLLLAAGFGGFWRKGLRVLETSPRLDERYRAAMGSWFDYTSSDYDERAHRGAVRIDLQDIDLPDDSLDLVLTPHVLEHVPDTDAALAELARVLAPSGRVALQVPVLQGRTAPPVEPEFHGDDTPVFWRFGYDLTARLEAQGWKVRALCTESWARAVRDGWTSWTGEVSGEFDVPSMLAGAPQTSFEVGLDEPASRRYGVEPGYQFLTWVCDDPRPHLR